MPVGEKAKDFVRKNIDCIKIQNFFENPLNTETLIGEQQVSLDNNQGFVTAVENMVKQKLVTTLLNAVGESKLISDNMTYNEKLNVLIDLKNSGQLDVINIILADILESAKLDMHKIVQTYHKNSANPNQWEFLL